MIKRMKENLKSKKGFTLVELIVVIVIILILAAVMIPNVMRYIGQARESTFQTEASGYLTEVQGIVAEVYAKTSENIKATDFKNEYALTNSDKVTITIPSPYEPLTKPITASGVKDRSIAIEIEKGAVTKFSYANTEHSVVWTQTNGWLNVDEEPSSPATP